MKNLLTMCLILVSGLGLGWMANEHLGNDTDAVFQERRATSGPSVQFTPASSYRANTLPSIEQRLNDNDYDGAVQQLERLLGADDENAAKFTRLKLITFARTLVSQQRYREAEQFLERFILASYRDIEAHTLLAISLEKQQRLDAAINRIILARGHAFQAADIAALDRRLQGLVNRQAERLREAGDQNAIVALYQKLIQMDAEHLPYYFNLAAAFETLGQYPDAVNTLALIQHNASVAIEIERRLQALEERQQPIPSESVEEAIDDELVVPLSRRNNGFVVDALLSNVHVAPLLIDTGATLTILTPQTLPLISGGYRVTDKYVQITTANGKVRAQVHTLNSLALGDWEAPDLEFCVLELGVDGQVSGLLGMNFLSHFQFFIDQQRSALHLQLIQN